MRTLYGASLPVRLTALAALCISAWLSLPSAAGTWEAHLVIPFGPIPPCNACTPVPGQLTVRWDTPALGESGETFTIDHYVLVYETDLTVSFITDIPSSANSYTLAGLTSGAVYKVWLEAHSTDGTHAVTPIQTLTAP